MLVRLGVTVVAIVGAICSAVLLVMALMGSGFTAHAAVSPFSADAVSQGFDAMSGQGSGAHQPFLMALLVLLGVLGLICKISMPPAGQQPGMRNPFKGKRDRTLTIAGFLGVALLLAFSLPAFTHAGPTKTVTNIYQVPSPSDDASDATIQTFPRTDVNQGVWKGIAALMLVNFGGIAWVGARNLIRPM